MASNKNKPLTARQARRLINKPIAEMDLQECRDRYQALWDLIMNPPTSKSGNENIFVRMWLDEQTKIKTAITLLEAKLPQNIGDYGNDQPKNT